MIPEKIDYDDLKKRGFLKQKQEGFFVLRSRQSSSGSYSGLQLARLAEISKRYARGIIHATTRQGLEIPFIKYEDIPAVEREVFSALIDTGTSGPRLRATTVCPGNNWCKQGLVNTFALAERIEKEAGLKCGLDLPHKFKIAISGCPNACTRPQATEIGVHAQLDSATKEIGYVVYIGGCGGRASRLGVRLEKVYTEDEVLHIIEKVVNFYKDHAKPRQRLGALIEELGIDEKDIIDTA
jgi:dissimilatory sulfite reductase (desulfoviridin) alpha/beta subunit